LRKNDSESKGSCSYRIAEQSTIKKGGTFVTDFNCGIRLTDEKPVNPVLSCSKLVPVFDSIDSDKYRAIDSKTSQKKLLNKTIPLDLRSLISEETIITVNHFKIIPTPMDADHWAVPANNDSNPPANYYSNQIGEVNDEKMISKCQEGTLHLNSSLPAQDDPSQESGLNLLDSQISFKIKIPLTSELESPKSVTVTGQLDRSIDHTKLPKPKLAQRSQSEISRNTNQGCQSEVSNLDLFTEKIVKARGFIRKVKKWFSGEVQNYFSHKPNTIVGIYREVIARFQTFTCRVAAGEERVTSMVEKCRTLGGEGLTKDFEGDRQFILEGIEAILGQLALDDPLGKFTRCVEGEVRGY
jgi:hypothetical protein